MLNNKLRHSVKFQKLTPRVDSFGAPVDEWADIFETGAAVEPLSVRDFIASQQEQSQVNARITIRYRTGVTPDMRIIHRGTAYNIVGILPDKTTGMEYLTIPVKAI